MPYIIAMSGRKGAGKSTLGDVICSWYTSKHPSFAKQYSFADNLKEFCINTLGLRYEQCYGTDEEKNTLTEYKWEDALAFYRWKFSDDVRVKALIERNIPPDDLLNDFVEDWRLDRVSLKTGYMTGREVMQIFGTDLIRQTFGNVWAKATVRKILNDGVMLGVITDNRFPNEANTVLEQTYGYIIRLTRSPYGTKDAHPSESALDRFDWNRQKCFVLDNAIMDLRQQSEAIVPLLNSIFC